jgi:hypothetical protein
MNNYLDRLHFEVSNNSALLYFFEHQKNVSGILVYSKVERSLERVR